MDFIANWSDVISHVTVHAVCEQFRAAGKVLISDVVFSQRNANTESITNGNMSLVSCKSKILWLHIMSVASQRNSNTLSPTRQHVQEKLYTQQCSRKLALYHC